jgi:hypothetical protein
MKVNLAFALVVSLGCSSGSETSSTSESCNDLSDQSALSGTATLTSGAAECPQSIPLDFGPGDSAAPSGCAPVVTGCTESVSCTETVDGVSTSIQAQVTVSGTQLSGSETVTVSTTAGPVTCKYQLSGTLG